jgi:two-component system invasion response regulator UvrY
MKKDAKIKLFLVDDHELVRTGLKVILESENDITVIGEANTGEEALQKVRENKPDVVLMDINMPGIGGLETTKRLRRSFPDIRIIVVTACSADPYPSKLVQQGALGFLAKNCRADELITAVRKAAKGERYMSSEIAQEIALRGTEQKKSNKDGQILSLLSTVPDRELQVLIMLAKGLTVKEIANKLVVTTKTINTYRYRLFKKLHVKNDVMLVHIAIQQGLVSIDESGNIVSKE